VPTLRVNGIVLCYDRRPAAGGAPALATPLVIVHGFAAGRDDWNAFVERACDRGPVLTYDLRGHGRSGAGLHPEQTSLTDLTTDLTHLLDALGIKRAHVLGHSLGGMVALDFVLRHPARTHGLVLVSTTPEPAPPDQRALMLRLLGDGPSPPAPSPMPSTGYALITRPDQTPHLGGIVTPTLVLVGEQEGAALQRGAELLHGWIPTSRLVRIEGAGHHAHLEQPEAFTQLVLGFLREVDRAGE
jgi:pimeloyl-ACP methyl ester carboxylesterase